MEKDEEHTAEGSPDRLGLEIRTRLFGDLRARPRTPAAEVAPDVEEIAEEILWGRIWAHPALDLRTKSLCTITALLALERYDYARAHISGARRLGIERDEVVGVARHLLFYVGLPVVNMSLALIKDVYDAPPDLAYESPTTQWAAARDADSANDTNGNL